MSRAETENLSGSKNLLFLVLIPLPLSCCFFKSCKTEQEKENDKPHRKGGLCGETLHFYIVVCPHCLSWLQTERHPGLLKPDSQSVCTDAAWWSNLTVLFAYLDALTTSIRNATCVVREDICCAIFIV